MTRDARHQVAVDNARVRGEQHAPDWSHLIVPAIDFIDGPHNVADAEGWDVWFNGQFVCRRLFRSQAREIIRALKADPALAVAYQVHES